MTGYYDLVLWLIPAALVGITAALTVVGVSLTAAVPAGAVVSIALIGHALFVRAPVDGSEEVPTASTIRSETGHARMNAD